MRDDFYKIFYTDLVACRGVALKTAQNSALRGTENAIKDELACGLIIHPQLCMNLNL